ncbi:hypothetical protein GCM10010413_30580 [Promicromonospora sukumoe]|uniref:Putative GNAT superfamily acetyltransferase n=1 Tax=Promicromonospora sukumoe TaxID=88382 RepID=A0A7W3PDC3_9MICO|nr:hypothetical protein [Promicromonospora sukumoe]MBA8807810.1 putative GNAT superfamily acetyltransferase [Promicromonospora sukumoe]
MDLDHSTITAARASATRAARRSRVRIRTLDSTTDSFTTEKFLSDVWQTAPEQPPIAADVIKAIADAGSYVAGAIDASGDDGGSEAGSEGELIGACIGFWGPPGGNGMHSHIAGVHAGTRGRSVGLALKLDQRARVLEHGVGEITWTFDPLVARNAHFNLRKLGGTVDRYLVDHYGRLADGINGDDPSDRLLLRWDLAGPRARAACDTTASAALPEASTAPEPAGPTPRAVLENVDDRPVPRAVPLGDGPVLVTVPPDIEQLRTRDPRIAADWRTAVRDTLGALLADGGRVVDFDRTLCGYIVEDGAV